MFPKKLHLTCKDKTNIQNPIWKKCIQRYRELYNDYEIIIYDDNDIYSIVEKHFPQYVEDIKKINIGAVLADIFRYLILYLEGGIYSDMDCEPLKKIDNLFTDIHSHGNNDGVFNIYPIGSALKDRCYDTYINYCKDSHKLRYNNLKQKMQCPGHKYVNKNTKVIIGFEFLPFAAGRLTRKESHARPQWKKKQICQWFMISTPKQTVFLKAFHKCMDNIKKLQKIQKGNPHYIDTIMKCSGPELFTQIVSQNMSENITILPLDFFCSAGEFGWRRRGGDRQYPTFSYSFSPIIPITKNSYIKHHFTGVWK